MVQSDLCLHRGARYVERGELEAVPAPPATPTWFPLGHSQVLSAVESTLQSSGYQVTASRLGLSQDDQQFFGVLDLAHRLADGVNLAIGVRNSTNKTFPLGFCAGNRVFCCDNLAFHSDLIVRKKHTRYGRERFVTAIAEAVAELQHFQISETKRIAQFQAVRLRETEAEALILRSMEQGIVPSRLILTVLGEWRAPSFDAFRPRTLWSLENAFTTTLREVAQRNPARYAALTMRLQGVLATAALFSAEAALAQAA